MCCKSKKLLRTCGLSNRCCQDALESWCTRTQIPACVYHPLPVKLQHNVWCRMLCWYRPKSICSGHFTQTSLILNLISALWHCALVADLLGIKSLIHSLCSSAWVWSNCTSELSIVIYLSIYLSIYGYRKYSQDACKYLYSYTINIGIHQAEL